MPRKTTKKPTTKKVAAKKTAVKKAAPKRKKYQTGGAAKTQRPRLTRDESMRQQEERRIAMEREREAARLRQEAEMQRQIEIMRQDRLPPEPAPEPDVSQYADRINATMQRYRREQGLMELGNRQRAAAERAAAERAAAARARTTSRRGPTAAEQARNMAEYERAMRARQANLSRGSTPSPRPTPRPAPPSNIMDRYQYQQELQNRRIGTPARPPATSINVGGGKALPAIPNPNYRPPVRPNTGPATPPRPNANATIMTREGITFNQQMQAERSRIQQQIAQLQARLRQLGG